MKFENLQPGMTVYSVDKTTMGNTRLKTVSVRPVSIVSVDPNSRTVNARWNHNAERTFHASSYNKWKATQPVLIRNAMGMARLATPAEREALKAESKVAS